LHAGVEAPPARLRLVLDTNVWLDWLVFSDPAIEPIRAAVAAGSATILMNPACEGELERALGYPFRGKVAEADVQAACRDEVRGIVQRFDAPPAPGAIALPSCRDPDDQKFLELARDCAADWLVTRDKALLVFARRRLRPLPFRIGTPKQFREETRAMT